ncbi:MAG: glycosyltransferase [Actinomycetota bacterium]
MFLFRDWDTPPLGFTRKRLILALAREFKKESVPILCLDRPVCPLVGLLRQRKKLWEKLTGRRGLKQLSPNLFLFTPWVILHEKLAVRFTPAAKMNRFLVRRQVRNRLRRLGASSRVVSWVFHPYQRDMIGALGEDFKIYECYDDYTAPNYVTPDKIPWVKQLEEQVLARVDLVFTTSQALYDMCKRKNGNTHLVPNGVDYELFSQASGDMPLPARLRSVKPPRIGFLGKINLKLDFELICFLASSRPDWNFVFLGPNEYDQEGVTERRVEEVKTLKNIHLMGVVPYEDIPAYMARFDACFIPYVRSELTHAIYPLKLNEYLATGKPVITTNFADLSELRDVITIAEGKEALFFERAQRVEKAIEESLKERNDDRSRRAQEIARKNSWDNRATLIHQTIKQNLTR